MGKLSTILKRLTTTGTGHVCTEGVTIPRRNLIVCKDCGEDME